MQNKRLLNALAKAGATVTPFSWGHNGFQAIKGNNRIEWFVQGERAVCVCTPSPLTDAMTDCFCDHFHHTIKSAVREMDRT